LSIFVIGGKILSCKSVETTHGECDTLKALMTIVINFLRGYLGMLMSKDLTLQHHTLLAWFLSGRMPF